MNTPTPRHGSIVRITDRISRERMRAALACDLASLLETVSAQEYDAARFAHRHPFTAATLRTSRMS